MLQMKILQFILISSVITFTNAQTALLFGASGTVGSEILHALSRNPFWDEIILVGRRFPNPSPSDDGDDANGGDNTPRISKVKMPDLANVDQEEFPFEVDACIIAVGVGNPQDQEMHYWHSVEVDMLSSMARLCNKVGAHYISLLSAVTSTEDPTEFSLKDELNDIGRGPIGWWRMIVDYERMKGLSEKGVVTAAKNIPFIRIFRPSSIVTDFYRYGWVDYIIFKFHKVFDPYLPEKYRSVKVKLLGMAMAGDAVEILRKREGDISSDQDPVVTHLTYGDFVRISGEEFDATQLAKEKQQTAGKDDEM